MIANLFVSTFLSLKAHKLRVFLTMVGIIIGITSVVTISALGEGMKRQVVKASSAVNADVLKIHYTMSDGSSDNFMSYEEPDYTFSRVDLKKLQDIQGIESIYPQYGESMMGGGDNLFVPMDYFGAQANLSITSTKGQNDILYGRDFQPSDANTDAIVLNHDIFETQIRLDDPSQLIGKAVSIGGYMYKVIGILAPKDLDSLGMNDDWATAMSSFVSRESYNKLAKTKAISGINIKVREGADREAILGQAITILSENHPEVKGTFKENDQDQQLQQQMEEMVTGMTMFLMAITAISLLVGGIGVMNIMYVSVTERKREIGIRRAIGAKPRVILFHFLMEAAFITLIGGLIGVGCGYLLATVVGGYISITPIITPSIFAISTLVSVFTGIFFGIIPAIGASRMDPIKAIYN